MATPKFKTPPLSSQPSRLAGFGAVMISVALVTALIYPIKSVAPAVSTGVFYLLAVMLVSTIWGIRLGLVTALLSTVAFNFFHIPPTGRLTIGKSENWVALAMFIVTAIVVSTISELARSRALQAEQRRREAELAAALARLYSAAPVEDASRAAGLITADALGLDDVEIALGKYAVEGPSMHILHNGNEPIASLRYRGSLDDESRSALREAVIPALEALIAAGIEREQLTAEVVEKEALRQSDELKTALLRAVSHDLRSPLTAIAAAGDALQAEQLDPEDRRALAEAVSDEAARLTSLVEKLLDLSRLQAGEVDPRRDWCAVDEIVEVAVEHSGAAPGQVTLRSENAVPLVRADGAMLERAFANLVENAVRYSNGSAVAITLRGVNDKVIARVVDRGPGIPDSDLESVFQPFQRGETNNHTGAGLGLAIVRGMIEANGGRVWAESLPGQGATFVVELPAETIPAQVIL